MSSSIAQEHARALDPQTFNPFTEVDWWRACDLEDNIAKYGIKWFCGAFREILDNKRAFCSCCDDSDDPCYRCLIREGLGMPEDRRTREDLMLELAAMRAEQ